MPPEVWSILSPFLAGLIAWAVSTLQSNARAQSIRQEVDAAKSEAAKRERENYDKQNRFFFEQHEKLTTRLDDTNSKFAAAESKVSILQDQLQEARAHSADRDRLLGILQEKDEQKARLIEQLTLDVATKSSLQADVQKQLAETVEKLERTTQERDDIQTQLADLLPLKEEQARQAQQITDLLERQAARHEQLNEWQAAMMEKDAELGRANARIAELVQENEKLKADLATATADLERATQALAKATQGIDRAVQGMDEAAQSMNNAAQANEKLPEGQK